MSKRLIAWYKLFRNSCYTCLFIDFTVQFYRDFDYILLFVELSRVCYILYYMDLKNNNLYILKWVSKPDAMIFVVMA